MHLNSGQATRVMGIVNVTPDSFSDGGVAFRVSDAVNRACQLIEDGADILDVGGESTRPGAAPVSAEEEWKRLGPVLHELCQVLHLPVSVDTYRAKTAAQALELGAIVINDVWGGLADPDMIPVVAEADCTYVWMHNRTEPAANAFPALVEETKQGLERALTGGVRPERLWIDPGIGFGKTLEDNLVILNRLSEYCELSYPVLLGTSRKRVIGETLGVAVSDRLAGSLATVALGVWAGVQAVRVHDVKETVRACRMVEAIRSAGGGSVP